FSLAAEKLFGRKLGNVQYCSARSLSIHFSCFWHAAGTWNKPEQAIRDLNAALQCLPKSGCAAEFTLSKALVGSRGMLGRRLSGKGIDSQQRKLGMRTNPKT
ncbi:MAG: hypothetical protein EA424_00050, partial [Planctomycetaceae bacterium]